MAIIPVSRSYPEDFVVFVLLSVFSLIDDFNSRFLRGLFSPCVRNGSSTFPCLWYKCRVSVIDDFNSRFFKCLSSSCVQRGLTALPFGCLIEWLPFDRRLTIPLSLTTYTGVEGCCGGTQTPHSSFLVSRPSRRPLLPLPAGLPVLYPTSSAVPATLCGAPTHAVCIPSGLLSGSP